MLLNKHILFFDFTSLSLNHLLQLKLQHGVFLHFLAEEGFLIPHFLELRHDFISLKGLCAFNAMSYVFMELKVLNVFMNFVDL